MTITNIHTDQVGGNISLGDFSERDVLPGTLEGTPFAYSLRATPFVSFRNANEVIDFAERLVVAVGATVEDVPVPGSVEDVAAITAEILAVLGAELPDALAATLVRAVRLAESLASVDAEDASFVKFE